MDRRTPRGNVTFENKSNHEKNQPLQGPNKELHLQVKEKAS